MMVLCIVFDYSSASDVSVSLDFIYIFKYNSFYEWFFFFQAEDGIRDLTVNGVQTCALPIFLPLDQISSDACQNYSEAICYSKFSSTDDSRCDPARGLSAQGCTSSDSDGAALLSVLTCAAPFRIPIHSAGVFLLVHARGAGNLLARSNLYATCDVAHGSVAVAACLPRPGKLTRLNPQRLRLALSN